LGNSLGLRTWLGGLPTIPAYQVSPFFQASAVTALQPPAPSFRRSPRTNNDWTCLAACIYPEKKCRRGPLMLCLLMKLGAISDRLCSRLPCSSSQVSSRICHETFPFLSRDLVQKEITSGSLQHICPTALLVSLSNPLHSCRGLPGHSKFRAGSCCEPVLHR
jgi:hypothetical protein